MKPIFKLPKWVPIPQPVGSEDGSRKFPNNVDWCDYWIGLANNPSRGVVEFLIEEIEDYVLFNDNEYFESIDFWRGVSASSKMIEYLLEKPNQDFDGKTNLKDNIKWNFMFQYNSNPLIVDVINKYPEEVSWPNVCYNQWNDRLMCYMQNYTQHVNWNILSANPLPGAITILKNNEDKITDNILFNNNPDVFELLERRKDKINWEEANGFTSYGGSFPNVNTVKLYEKYYDEMKKYINWSLLSAVPEAIDLLEKNPDKICWERFSMNPHSRAVEMLKKNKEKINWENLSRNNSEHLFELLDENLKYINLNSLVRYNNKSCLKLLNKYWHDENFKFLFEGNCRVPEKYLIVDGLRRTFKCRLDNWSDFARRDDCIHLLKDAFVNNTHLNYMIRDNSFFRSLFSNPALFELDIEAMKTQNKLFAEEFAAKVYHPDRVNNMLKKYNYNIITEETCYPSDSEEESETSTNIQESLGSCH